MIRRTLFVLGLAMVLVPAAGPVPGSAISAQETGVERPAALQDAQGYGAAVEEATVTTAQNDFQAIQRQQAEARTLRGYWHLFIAFALTWLLLFGYAVTLGRRFGRLERELQRLAG